MSRTVSFDEEIIIGNAMQVFWEKGFNATSMQDLVDATGLNRSSIYNTFGSKLALYRDCLAFYQKQTGGKLKKVLLKAGTPMEALRSIFDLAFHDILQDQQGKGCFNMNCKAEMGNQNLEIRNWLLGTQEEMLDLFETLIAAGQEEGSFNNKKPAREYAYFLFNGFQGLRMTGILERDKSVLNGIIENILSVFR